MCTIPLTTSGQYLSETSAISIPYTKFIPGQRVRVNEDASDRIPEFVGMSGTVGISGVHAPYCFAGEYFVSIHRDTGAKIKVQLPEHCIDEAPLGSVYEWRRLCLNCA